MYEREGLAPGTSTVTHAPPSAAVPPLRREARRVRSSAVRAAPARSAPAVAGRRRQDQPVGKLRQELRERGAAVGAAHPRARDQARSSPGLAFRILPCRIGARREPTKDSAKRPPPKSPRLPRRSRPPHWPMGSGFPVRDRPLSFPWEAATRAGSRLPRSSAAPRSAARPGSGCRALDRATPLRTAPRDRPPPGTARPH